MRKTISNGEHKRGDNISILDRIVLSIFLVFCLPVSLSFGQDSNHQHWIKGAKYAVEGNFIKAREEIEKIPRDSSTYANAKVSLKIMDDMGEKIIKEETVVYLFKGAIHAFKGEWDDAISDYNMAIEINPDYALTYNNRAPAYRHKGQYDRAILDYNEAIARNPDFTDAYNNRGICYFYKGLSHKAILDFSKIIEIDPRFADAYVNRGFVYMKSGDLRNACTDWEKACDLGKCDNYWIAKRQGNCK